MSASVEPFAARLTRVRAAMGVVGTVATDDSPLPLNHVAHELVVIDR